MYRTRPSALHLPLSRFHKSFSSTRRLGATPVSIVHDTLVTLHDVSTLPWSAVIPLSTLVLSLLTFPIAYKSRLNTIRLISLRPILSAHTREVAPALRRQSASPREFERALQAETRRWRKELHARHGVDLRSLLLLPACKIPLWITFSLTLRSMAGLSLPFSGQAVPDATMQSSIAQGFSDEGIEVLCGHIDLSSPPSVLILPVLFGVLNLVNVEVTAAQYAKSVAVETDAGARSETISTTSTRGRLGRTLEWVGRIASIVFIPIAAQMPSALGLYWVSSTAATLLQNLWLNRHHPIPRSVEETSPMVGRSTVVREQLTLPTIDENSVVAASKRSTASESEGTDARSKSK